ncbi:MAG: hypothetical protein XXXNARYT_003253 [Candidatus Accumulibacter regalis]|jgi:hypothetical protein
MIQRSSSLFLPLRSSAAPGQGDLLPILYDPVRAKGFKSLTSAKAAQKASAGRPGSGGKARRLRRVSTQHEAISQPAWSAHVTLQRALIEIDDHAGKVFGRSLPALPLQDRFDNAFEDSGVDHWRIGRDDIFRARRVGSAGLRERMRAAPGGQPVDADARRRGNGQGLVQRGHSSVAEVSPQYRLGHAAAARKRRHRLVTDDRFQARGERTRFDVGQRPLIDAALACRCHRRGASRGRSSSH